MSSSSSGSGSYELKASLVNRKDDRYIEQNKQQANTNFRPIFVGNKNLNTNKLALNKEQKSYHPDGRDQQKYLGNKNVGKTPQNRKLEKNVKYSKSSSYSLSSSQSKESSKSSGSILSSDSDCFNEGKYLPSSVIKEY